MKHAQRDHAVWSASATAANWTCPGRMSMVTLAPEDEESIHAARGTACHEIAERALRFETQCEDYLGETIKTKKFEIEIDEELVESAQMYVDYVNGIEVDANGAILYEERFTLAELHPPFDAGGTCDAIAVNYAKGILEVVDLKNGRGVVEVNENKQLRTYALLAFLNLNSNIIETVETVKSTIVQPRAYHKDGRLRSETFHVSELVEWTHDLMEAMRRSKEASDAFEEINGSRTKFDEWAKQYLVTGACKFCPAYAMCPANKVEALSVAPDIAKQWFEDPTLETPPMLKNDVDLLSPEELAHILNGLDNLEDWIAAVRSHAHTLAERGTQIPGYQLAEKIGNRKWNAEEEQIVTDLKTRLGLNDEQIYQKKLKSIAQIEMVIGAKRKGEIENLQVRPVTGTNLVSEKKSSRPSVKSMTGTFFETVKD